MLDMGVEHVGEPQLQPEIVNLEALVKALPPKMQRAFHRLFHVSTTVGRLDPPPEMHDWIKGYFGSVEAVLSQRIVKVTNLVTMEGALFNELRSRRPMEVCSSANLDAEIEGKRGDPFCTPLTGTPADVFGRVRGRRAITASNIAKYDGFHGLVIFNEHHPLRFTADDISDYLDIALAWAHRAHEVDPEARYFFLMWNCLWKSGASIIHGHMQMTLTRGLHYPKVEALRRAARSYRLEHSSDYFEDLYAVHHALGLAMESRGIRVLSYLTPVKEKEILLIAGQWDENLKRILYDVLHVYVTALGVQSFNVAVYYPPLAAVAEDWSGFPVIVRLVDRGNPHNQTADFGAMELYAASVITSDPFYVAHVLRQLQGGLTPHEGRFL